MLHPWISHEGSVTYSNWSSILQDGYSVCDFISSRLWYIMNTLYSLYIMSGYIFILHLSPFCSFPLPSISFPLYLQIPFPLGRVYPSVSYHLSLILLFIYTLGFSDKKKITQYLPFYVRFTSLSTMISRRKGILGTLGHIIPSNWVLKASIKMDSLFQLLSIHQHHLPFYPLPSLT